MKLTKKTTTKKPDHETVSVSTEGEQAAAAPQQQVPFSQLFRFAEGREKAAMMLATIASICNGGIMPLWGIVMGDSVDVFVKHDILVGRRDIDPTPFTPQVMASINSDFEDEILKVFFKFLAMAACTFVVAFLQMSLWQWIGKMQAERLRRAYFKALLTQEVAFFDDQKRGELTARITADVERIQAGVGDKVGHTIMNLGTWVIGYALGFSKNAEYMGIMLSGLPFLVLAFGIQGMTLIKLARQAILSSSRAAAVAEEGISSIRTVASFGAEDRETARFAKLAEEIHQADSQTGNVSGAGQGSIYLVAYLSHGLLLWYGSRMLANGEIPVGTVVSIFTCYFFGSLALGQIAPFIGDFAQARSAAFEIFNVIDRDSHVDPFNESGLKPETVKGRIEFTDVDFAYPTRPDVQILKKFNLMVEPGTTVALVGQSGSGKSTCVGLLERFYVPLAGTVTLDGVSIETLNVQWLRGHIGYVGQEPVLFNGTLRQNIAWGSHAPVTDEEIWAALRQANADTFVADLPDKLDTMIGERGANMSGGQKQRLAIARCLIRNPKIIFFDEATSALDTQSEAVVQEALNRAAEGRTAIVIAHRLSTVRNADKIVAMRKGEVIEAGSHDELIAQQGFYYSLVRDQQIEEEGEAAINDEDDDGEDTGADSPFIAPVDLPLPDHIQLVGDKPGVVSAPSTLGRRRPSHVSDVHSTLGRDGGSITLGRSLNRQESTLGRTLGRSYAAAMPTLDDEVPLEPHPFKRAMRMNADQWKLLLLGTISALVAGTMTPLYAFVYSLAVTDLGRHLNDPTKLRSLGDQYSLLFVGIAILAALAYYFQSFAFVKSGESLVFKLRVAVFAKLITMEQSFYDRPENTVGALAGKFALESSQLHFMVGDVLGSIVQCGCSAVVGATLALVWCWRLALVAIFGAPFLFAANVLQMRAASGMTSPKEDQRAAAITSEAVSNLRTVASLGLEDRFLERYGKQLDSIRGQQNTAITKSGFYFGSAYCLLFIIYGVAFYYTGKLIEWDLYTFQDAYPAMTVVISTTQVTARFAQFVPDVIKGYEAAKQLFQLADRTPLIDVHNPPADALVLGDDCKGEIVFEDVHFRYPSRPKVRVHRGLSLRVPAGAKVALVGASGCGKSTCIQQLERFYDPTKGKILIDGIDITTLNVRSLREKVALVGQEPTLFDGTILDNIKYGAVDPATATDEDVYEAARQADVHEFIMSLPQGYQTPVGERGGMLSGGQKQRVAVSRALMRKPTILLLDEATSALDAESEVAVQRALDAASRGRTTVAIAHRLSTVVNSDIIYVLHHGRVIESGTHTQLFAQRGHYFRLVEAQME